MHARSRQRRAMYKIGDFSQLAQVSVRTLRHYDEQGLLEPNYVDDVTNYRYYTADQIPHLNRVLALRDLGFSLNTISQMLEADIEVGYLRELLTAKQREIELDLREKSQRLRQVAYRLQQIEQRGTPSPYDVVVKSLPLVSLITVRETVPHVAQMGQYRERSLKRLYGWLERMDVDHGIELFIYHNESYTSENIDMSVGVVVDQEQPLPPTPPDIGKTRVPSSEHAASITHNGPIVDAPDIASALYGWLGMNGYASAGPYREIHLFGKELDAFDNYTRQDYATLDLVYEVVLPIQRF